VRAAAIRALQRLPERAWPGASEIDPVVTAIVEGVRRLPASRRADQAALDAMQLAEKLTAALPDARRLAVRRDLRALGVQVVRISTVPEQMAFDVRWFAVQAGRPVQIAMTNADTMPHNLVVGAPGSLQTIGAAAMSMAMPADSDAKPFVPESPSVLQSTRLLKEGETARLSFTAPGTPGEYVYLCSFPGHFTRMYGVMVVVPNLDAWDANPGTPIDPMTNRPFTSQRY
jgi:azurin